MNSKGNEAAESMDESFIKSIKRIIQKHKKFLVAVGKL